MNCLFTLKCWFKLNFFLMEIQESERYGQQIRNGPLLKGNILTFHQPISIVIMKKYECRLISSQYIICSYEMISYQKMISIRIPRESFFFSRSFRYNWCANVNIVFSERVFSSTKEYFDRKCSCCLIIDIISLYLFKS